MLTLQPSENRDNEGTERYETTNNGGANPVSLNVTKPEVELGGLKIHHWPAEVRHAEAIVEASCELCDGVSMQP
jgi:hypothetical protein